MKSTYMITGLLVFLLVVSGCVVEQLTKEEIKRQQKVLVESAQLEASQDLKKFSSIQELREFLQKQAALPGITERFAVSTGADVMMAESAVMASAPATKAAGAADYSQTNVQYKAVDEGDFVKNDDRYIYMIADNNLIIIDAYDAENSEIISETKIGDNDWKSPRAKELFIKDDKLVLFVETNEPSFYFERYDIEPRQTYRQKLNIQTYDISDRSNPEITSEYSVTGRYFQSRMIDDKIYIVTQERINDIYYITGPVVMESSRTITPEIYYFDNPDQNYQFNTIVSIDITNEEVVDSKTFMLGYSNTLMVSENNIYISYQKQPHWRWYSRYDKERFYDIVLPRLPLDIRSDIKSIQDKSEQETWRKISEMLSGFYQKIEEQDLYDEYEDMFGDIADALEEYDTRKALEERKTVIHKIGIEDGKLNYNSKAEIDGTLLNQFSIDEYNGYLRAATTVNVWSRRTSVIYNNVYVLDQNMNQVGEIEHIAKGESIYAARFLGNKLYMVTFERTDPLFVIDLSNPSNPKILGELKIPGYSDYLHPYDEDRIIGIGKGTQETEWGFTTGGVKIALFDVSDVNNPKEVDKVEIGDKGSDSSALHNHHAFLFSKTKNLLVLPITEVTKREKLGQYRYSNSIWYGAYVFKVSDDGFEKIGKVRHSSTKTDYFNWWNEAAVLRSLYMDDNLYTVSNKYVKINDLSNDLEELNSIKLPYSGRYYWR